MVNLGICRKCPKCTEFSPAIVIEDGTKTKLSYVECALTAACLGWDGEVPEGCPFVLEQKLTEESVEDLDGEEKVVERHIVEKEVAEQDVGEEAENET